LFYESLEPKHWHLGILTRVHSAENTLSSTFLSYISEERHGHTFCAREDKQ
jgi:hypothetical protein